MMLQLFARLAPVLQGCKNEPKDVEATQQTETRDQLYSLLCFVQREIARTEQLFGFAEEDALIDNLIYTLKSLRSQQQYLVQNIRRLDGIGEEAPSIPQQATPDGQGLPREGFVMG